MNSSSLNRCNIPPWAIASKFYNAKPVPLEIQGVRHNGRPLFEKLDLIDDQSVRAGIFHDFMDVRFQLHHWEKQSTKNSRKSLKNSYLRFLRGWQFDSNSLDGAVLKGWVESRFGLVPTFHHEPIQTIHSGSYYRYTWERMKGAERTNAIFSQFDLLYEYIQYELRKNFSGQTHMKLYRGVYNFEEHQVLEDLGKKRYLLRLNNLNSFTRDFERAWEFGSRVLSTQVPLTKVFFLGGILPKSLFKGEDEFMVIGGEYIVDALTGG